MLNSVEKLYCVLGLIFFSGAILPVFTGENDNLNPQNLSNVYTQSVRVAIWLGLLFFILLRLRKSTRLIVPQFWLAALVAWMAASAAWSGNSETTIVRTIITVFSILFGLYFGTSFSSREQMRMLLFALIILAALSAVVAVFLPQYGIVTDPGIAGSWRGVFGHKNNLGTAMVLLCICCASLWSSREANRLLLATALFLGIVMTFLSRSAGAEVTLAIVLLLALLSRMPRLHVSMLIPVAGALFIALVGIAVLAVQQGSLLLSLMGRNATLTGRVPLWNLVLKLIAIHPLIGYGYGAFWQGIHGPSNFIEVRSNWQVPHAHNLILDLWLDLGLVGVALFLLSYFSTLRRALRLFRNGDGRDHTWGILLLAAFFLFNLVEDWFVPSTLFLVLFSAATVAQPIRIEQIIESPDHEDAEAVRGGVLLPRRRVHALVDNNV
jgi:O-antigen ligase